MATAVRTRTGRRVLGRSRTTRNGDDEPSAPREAAVFQPRLAGGRLPANDGSRAVPGKAPRGSFPVGGSGVFTALGRLILDRIDRGVILIDGRRRVRDANALARRLLAEPNGLKISSGRLRFVRADLDARLSRQIADYRKGGEVRPVAFRLRQNGRPPYRLVVVPVPPRANEREVAFVLLIYGPPERREISTQVLIEMYGLTPAQAEVARSMFAGRSVESTAAALDLSRNTVRTHLNAIFTRCDVRSQRELLHLLATGPSQL